MSKQALKIEDSSRGLSSLISTHVMVLIDQGQQEREFDKEEAVRLISNKLKDVPGANIQDIRDIIVNKYLRPGRTDGKFVFKKLKEDENLDFDLNYKELLKLYDAKLANMSERIKGMIIDNSEWQSKFFEQKRQFRSLDMRIGTIEEQNETLDIGALQSQETVSIAEIIKVIKYHQADILKKTVSQNDWSNLKF